MTNDRGNDTVPEPLLREAARRPPAAPGPDCIDADTLAAWADGKLPEQQLRTVENHAAGCDRCRTLLAAMARTEPPRIAAPWWTQPVVRWAVPLGAVAAALLVWVATDPPAERLAEPAATQSVAVAEAPSPAPATPVPQASVVDAIKPAPPAETKAKTAPPAPAASTPANPVASARKRDDTQSRSAAELRQEKATAADAVAAPSAAPLTRSLGAAAVAGPEIVAPDGAMRWRIGEPGSMSRSTDGGRTWQTQPLDTKARLAAGVAPAPGVCWVVGAGGVVLKTTDGRTWTRLSVPDAADLVAVTARDADVATVTTADRRSFRTTDGGVTWSRHPLQENPAAPF